MTTTTKFAILSPLKLSRKVLFLALLVFYPFINGLPFSLNCSLYAHDGSFGLFPRILSIRQAAFRRGRSTLDEFFFSRLISDRFGNSNQTFKQFLLLLVSQQHLTIWQSVLFHNLFLLAFLLALFGVLFLSARRICLFLKRLQKSLLWR